MALAGAPRGGSSRCRLRGLVLSRPATANGQRHRASRVIPPPAVLLPQQPNNRRRPRDCIGGCKRRAPRENLGSSAAAGSPGPGGGRPARPGGVLCKGSGGSLRVAFLVIRVAFLAVERRDSEPGVGAVSGGVGGVGGRSGSVVGGVAFVAFVRSVWPPHVCTKEPAPVKRGVDPSF